MGGNLIYYAIVFLIVAIVAAALGFGGVAGTAVSGAHLLLMVAVVFIVIGLLRSGLDPAELARQGDLFQTPPAHPTRPKKYASGNGLYNKSIRSPILHRSIFGTDV